jgi:hypothetical protein
LAFLSSTSSSSDPASSSSDSDSSFSDSSFFFGDALAATLGTTFSFFSAGFSVALTTFLPPFFLPSSESLSTIGFLTAFLSDFLTSSYFASPFFDGYFFTALSLSCDDSSLFLAVEAAVFFCLLFTCSSLDSSVSSLAFFLIAAFFSATTGFAFSIGFFTSATFAAAFAVFFYSTTLPILSFYFVVE